MGAFPKKLQHSAADKDQFEMPPWLILGERRIGSFRREFSFPVDVDMEKLSAKLEAGLLTIKVPKRINSYPRGSGKLKIVSADL